MDQKSVQNEEGQWESESDWVIEQFEHMAYYAFPVLMTAQDYGSPMARIRWWLVILDIEPACAKRMGIEQHVYEILNSLKEGCAEAPYSVDNFLLDADISERLVDALPYKVRTKVNRLDEEWKNTRLNFCFSNGLEWPPQIDDVRSNGFGVRSSQVIVIAMAMFPLKQPNMWECFDASHDMIRIFSLDSPSEKLPNPWKRVMPTLVASSQIVGRVLRVVGDGGADPQVEVKRVHGLEMMRLMGWDLNMYRNGDAFGTGADGSDDSQTPELLASLAGNAWCMWHTVPLMLAILGSVNWADATRQSSTRALQLRRRATTDSEEDTDSSD